MDEYVSLKLEEQSEVVSGNFILYHNCQLPDQLSLETLLPSPIYASDDTEKWTSPHLQDTETYSLCVKVKKMLIVRDKTPFERLLTQGKIQKLLEESGADAIGYIALNGDDSSYQIYLTNAAEQITSVRRLATARCWDLKNAILMVLGIPAMKPLEYRAMQLLDNQVVGNIIRRAAPPISRHHILAVLSPTSILVQYVEVKPTDGPWGSFTDNLKELKRLVVELSPTS